MTDPELSTLFIEFATMLAIAVGIGLLAVRLRQPLIVAFIAVGILLGPGLLGLVEHSHTMELLAEFGIALLLFVVGLKLDLGLIRTMGPVALATGLGQITFTAGTVFLICQLLGMDLVPSLYVAAAMSFSSTIIIVKLLSDKREIDALHGRIAIGFLIVQDIMVVITMIVITAFGGNEDARLHTEILSVLLKGLALLGGVALLMRFILPRVLPIVASSTELLVLFSITLAISMAAVSDVIGFSKEVGAFLGGIALASTPYRESIGSRLTSVRDFLLLFFFISLGSQLDLAALGLQVQTAILLSLFVLVGNPLIVLSIMGLMGFRRRTGFLSGLAVAQISEFSLILAALGMGLGHIEADTVGLITLVALITIGTSTYMIIYSHQIYERIHHLLKPFEKQVPFRENQLQGAPSDARTEVIVFGLGRYGHEIAVGLQQGGRSVLGVDFDPLVIRKWKNETLSVQYGDAEDPEFLAHLPLSEADWVVSSIPDYRSNTLLIDTLRREGYRGQIAVTTHFPSQQDELLQRGCDLVLLPYREAASQSVQTILEDSAAVHNH